MSQLQRAEHWIRPQIDPPAPEFFSPCSATGSTTSRRLVALIDFKLRKLSTLLVVLVRPVADNALRCWGDHLDATRARFDTFARAFMRSRGSGTLARAAVAHYMMVYQASDRLIGVITEGARTDFRREELVPALVTLAWQVDNAVSRLSQHPRRTPVIPAELTNIIALKAGCLHWGDRPRLVRPACRASPIEPGSRVALRSVRARCATLAGGETGSGRLLRLCGPRWSVVSLEVIPHASLSCAIQSRPREIVPNLCGRFPLSG